VSFEAITLCIASERVSIVVNLYFVTDSGRKLSDTPSYFMTYTDYCIGNVLKLAYDDACPLKRTKDSHEEDDKHKPGS